MAEILIVDDEADLGDLLRLVLEIDGHRVRCAANGQAGLAALDEGLPDLILLDVEMPVLTGPEMACRMMVHDAGQERIPIVVISGVADVAAAARQVGTPYALEKPVSLDRLTAMVNRALRERIWPQPLAGEGGDRHVA